MPITALVTGANRGIGLAFVEHLTQRGDRVIALCRKSSPELEKLGPDIFTDVDVCNPESLEKVRQKLNEPIDLLINCAGILRYETLDEMNFKTIQEQLEVNALGPLHVTMTFLSHLKKGSKIAMITSRMGSIGDNASGGFYGYRASKAALNALSVSLAVDLKPHGISLLLLHPGSVKTAMIDYRGEFTPEETTKNMLDLIDEKGLEETGKFFHMKGHEIEW